MTSKARGLADLGNAFNDGALSNRNLIINGAMQVAQRGTSFSSISSLTYPVDRFFAHDTSGGSGEATVSQSTTTPDNFKYSLKWDVTTAATSLAFGDQYKVEYRIEGQDIAHLNWGTSAAQTVTLSFWMRSNKTGNTQVAIVNSANNRSYVAPFSINSANTWEKKELVISGDTSGTWLDTNGIGLRIRWGSYGAENQTSSLDQWIAGQAMSRDDSPINFMDSTANEFYLTGVQLEVGDTATPFEHRSYGQELALCLRYYWKHGASEENELYYRYGSHGESISSAQAQVVQQFPVRMRAHPTLTVNGAVSWYSNGTITNPSGPFSVDGNSGGTYSTCIVNTYLGTGLTSGRAGAFLSNNNTTSNMEWDAEL